MQASVLAIATYAILFLSKEVRTNRKLRAAAFLALTVHHLAALYNSTVSTLPGADGDSELFYQAAYDTAGTYRYQQMAYTKFLTFVFHFLTPSKLLGAELSIATYALCCVVIIDILCLLKRQRFATPVILLYGLLPSPVIHFSVTLRESYEALALLIIVDGTLHLRRRLSPIWATAIASALYCILAIHSSLKLLALGLIGLTLIMIAQKLGRGVVLGAGSLALAALIGGPGSFIVDESDLSDKIESVHEYRAGVIYAKGRAFYGGQVETSSVLAFLLSAPQVFFLYMLAPFPWQLDGILDIYTFAENSLRIILLIASVFYWRKARDLEEREQAIYILSVYMLTEAVWSLGTGNWGTALRHHVVALSLPIILGVPAILDRNQNAESAKAEKTKNQGPVANPKSTRGKIRTRRNRRGTREKNAQDSPQ